LNYVFQSDLLVTSADQSLAQYNTIGINQYLFYTLNDQWALGARVEWWHDDYPNSSWNEATFGVNYRPIPNLVFRPEFKHEWVPSRDFGPSFDTSIFGIDMVLTY